MRHTKESKMKNGIETMMIAVLCVVVLSLLFSIHVQSREADAAFTNTAYYQEQEKQYRHFSVVILQWQKWQKAISGF